MEELLLATAIITVTYLFYFLMDEYGKLMEEYNRIMKNK